jgi:hypothetical protein
LDALMRAHHPVHGDVTKRCARSAFVMVNGSQVLTVFADTRATPGSSGTWQVSSSNAVVPLGRAVAVKPFEHAIRSIDGLGDESRVEVRASCDRTAATWRSSSNEEPMPP